MYTLSIIHEHPQQKVVVYFKYYEFRTTVVYFQYSIARSILKVYCNETHSFWIMQYT